MKEKAIGIMVSEKKHNKAMDLFSSPKGIFILDQALSIAMEKLESMDIDSSHTIKCMKLLEDGLFPLYGQIAEDNQDCTPDDFLEICNNLEIDRVDFNDIGEA